MEQEKISARIEMNPYTNKVLAVIKAKYGLRDKSEAIDKFAEIYGEDIVEKEAKEEYIKEMIEGVNEHLRKYKNRKMSLKELDALFENV